MRDALAIGDFQDLPIVQHVDRGVMLDGGGQRLFLPSGMVADGADVGDVVRVFLYTDHDGAPQATTKQPAARVGEFAYLECVAITKAGAFLDWGIPKDLYVPPDQQTTRMVEGRRYVVAVVLDRKGERPIGSAQLNKHFDYEVEHVEQDDAVELLVYGHTDAGVQVVVNRCHRGLIHNSDAHQSLNVGRTLRGYVRQVRHDNRLDIALTRSGLDGITDAQTKILAALDAAGGELLLHDKSSPIEIKRAVGLSKKAFKRGIGTLYKARKIVIDHSGIRRVDQSDAD